MSNDKDRLTGEIFEALRSLVNRSFPIECSCGATFNTLDEFLEQTEKPEEEHGLFGPTEYEDTSIANLLRTCPNCGSTLLAVFSERRNTTRQGARVRNLFGRILSSLEGGGLDKRLARTEILKVVHGRDSEFLLDQLRAQNNHTLAEFLEAVDDPETG